MWLFRVWDLLCLAIGLFVVGVAIRNMVKGTATHSWPQSEGRILRAMVLMERDTQGGKGYTPSVEYEYVVNGTTYRGKRLCYGQTGSWGRKQAKRTVARFVGGSPAPVWFNPQNPQDAVLVRGTSWGNLAILAAGLVFLWVAYVLNEHIR
jgi:hypothetical protein